MEHSSSSGNEVENEWSHTSISLWRGQGKLPTCICVCVCVCVCVHIDGRM